MDASFWALVSLFLFFGVLAYFKVPGLITSALDKRAALISNEIEEAKRLREEAQQLLAEYQRKRQEAESEAADILAGAEREAAAIVTDARMRTEEFVARRMALAEQKIAQAESDALNEVRSSAIDLAVAAAERVIADKADASLQDELFTSSLASIKERMN